MMGKLAFVKSNITSWLSNRAAWIRRDFWIVLLFFSWTGLVLFVTTLCKFEIERLPNFLSLSEPSLGLQSLATTPNLSSEVSGLGTDGELRKEFEKFRDRVKIPLEKELQMMSSGEKIHALMESAHQTLRFRRFLEEHSWSKEEGFRFFLNCALNSEVLRSYRAECWNSAQTLYYEVFGKQLNSQIAPVTILRVARRQL
jgi:hypothetical protein